MNPEPAVDHEFLPFYTGDGGGQLTVCGVNGCTEPITSHPVNHPYVPRQIGRSTLYVCATSGCYQPEGRHPPKPTDEEPVTSDPWYIKLGVVLAVCTALGLLGLALLFAADAIAQALVPLYVPTKP